MVEMAGIIYISYREENQHNISSFQRRLESSDSNNLTDTGYLPSQVWQINESCWWWFVFRCFKIPSIKFLL